MQKTRGSFVVLVCLALSWGWSGGFAVSPKSPADLRAREAATVDDWSPWLLKRIKELETERKRLNVRLARAPRHNPVIPQSLLGYHSAVGASEGEDAAVFHTLRFSFMRRQFIRSIAFAPATSPLGPAERAYAFPRHFKIEIRNASTGRYRTVVDWMDEAFPDPGAYPAFFAEIDSWADQIRVSVPKRNAEGRPVYFALGEVYFFGGRPDRPSENVSIWGGVKVEASGSFDLARHWATPFLRDRLNNLGFPVMNRKDPRRKDLLISSDERFELPETVEILVDFSSIRKGVERMDIWPAEPPENLALLGFGFPENVTIEFSAYRDFRDSREVTRQALMESSRRDFRSLFSVRVRPPKARFARIRMSGLQEVGGRRVLGLGEISLYQSDGSLVRGASVSIKGLPESYEEQLGLLQDGFSWGRRILSEFDWIKGLAERRALDLRLAMVREELIAARRSLRAMQRQAVVFGGAGLAALFVGVLLLQKRKRRKMLLGLGERITRDLHDEVGSNLGSITLLADDLARGAQAKGIKGDLDELSLMAREANASLREIVWGSEQSSVSLAEFLEKLSDRAKRVFKGGAVEVFLPEVCPEKEVSLAVKRHLTMFFKEAVHNCARHAGASKLEVRASVTEGALRLEVSDDGCGFDTSSGSAGWGLSNMKKRACELGGEVEIFSAIGKGTSVVLSVPLRRLSEEPKQSYRTSN